MVYLSITIIVYVSTFSKDFKQEDLAKATPFIAIISLIVLILGILQNI